MGFHKSPENSCRPLIEIRMLFCELGRVFWFLISFPIRVISMYSPCEEGIFLLIISTHHRFVSYPVLFWSPGINTLVCIVIFVCIVFFNVHWSSHTTCSFVVFMSHYIHMSQYIQRSHMLGPQACRTFNTLLKLWGWQILDISDQSWHVGWCGTIYFWDIYYSWSSTSHVLMVV